MAQLRVNMSCFCGLTHRARKSGTFPQIQSPVYFNRSDVKAAIHAPENVSWDECNFPVFVNGVDNSPIVSWEVLPRVMNRGVPVVIVTGLADFIIQSEG
jgi:carboxypeptidase D